MRTLLCLFASVAFAQVAVERQPDLTVFTSTVRDALKKAQRSREVLEAAKPGTVDVKALEKDLLTMDFVEGCALLVGEALRVPRRQVFVSKGEPWLQVTAFGEKEYHRVLSSEAGVLVVKLSKDGRLRSKAPKWFAQVRVAIPRLFESTGR